MHAPALNNPEEADSIAAQLRGFGPLGLLAIVAIYFGNVLFTPLSALLILIWAWCSRTPWRDLGFNKSSHWLRAVFIALLFGCLCKLLMKTVVMPLLGAPPRNPVFQFFVGNANAIPEVLYMVLVGAAFGEEMLFRGFAFERLRRLWGQSAWAGALIVVVTSVWFALEHYGFQGMMGVQQAFIMGLIFGAAYLITKQLWFVMIAHASFDLTAIAIIYTNTEEQFAHFFFR